MLNLLLDVAGVFHGKLSVKDLKTIEFGLVQMETAFHV